MDLKNKVIELEQKLEGARANFFQIQGAISILKEQINEPKEEKKPEEKKDPDKK